MSADEGATEEKTGTSVKVQNGAGVLWFIGWQFTIAFAHLGWGKAILGIIVWPYFLGIALR